MHDYVIYIEVVEIYSQYKGHALFAVDVAASQQRKLQIHICCEYGSVVNRVTTLVNAFATFWPNKSIPYTDTV